MRLALPPGLRAGFIVPLVAFAALLPTTFVHAAMPAGHSPSLELVAPAREAVVAERGLRFAWTAKSTERHFLLVSRQPFDASGWTRLPQADGIEVRELAKPVATLEEAGVTIAGETQLHWAAADMDRETGRVTFSEVRAVKVLPRFSNRVEASPYLHTSPIGKARAIERTGPDRIRLRAGYAIDPARGEPPLASNMREAPGQAATRTYLVYYGDADPEVTRKSILASGGWVVSHVPDRTFLVRMKSAGQFALQGEGGWVGAYQPAYKLSPRLQLDQDAERVVNLLVFQDGDLAGVRQAIAAAGGRVVLVSDNGINKIVRAALPGTRVPELSQQPDVAWIEPYVQPMLDNATDQWVTQTGASNNRRVWDMGIHGEGQVVNTSDSGINTAHNQFRDDGFPIGGFGDYPSHRKVIAYKKGSTNPEVTFGDHSGASYHGTHTGGTIAGSDDGLSTDIRDGVAKYAKIYFMDISGTNLGSGVDPFADLNDLFLPPYIGNAGGAARISSNSWGSAVQGDYDLNSLNVDQFTWNHPDFLMCFSNGNSGIAGSVGSPATSKNSVGVGGTQNGVSSTTQKSTIYSSTSRGPTQDGRQKPTICTPGLNVSSANGSGTTSYQSLSGTSMASPGAGAAAALMRQYLTEGWYPTGAKVPANGFAPSAALLKAMLVNSGTNMVTNSSLVDFQAPDFNVGYGRVNVDSVLYFAGDARRLLLVDQTEGLGNGQAIEYQVNVTDGSIPLEVSMTWTDYPGNPAAVAQLVNNLDLTVTNGIVTYKGNVYTNGVSATGGSYDFKNVEESVRVAAPATGLWTVRIEGVAVPFGPQPYGLCITGGVGTNAGSIALDRASYGSGSTVEIQVADVNAVGPLGVTVTSATEPAGETVSLTGSNGIFTGTLQLSPFDGAGGDGTLQVSNGDQIEATYSDASPVAALVARAQVAIEPPIVTAVDADVQGAGVLVSWTTDRNASSKVYYGTTPALGSSSALDPTAVFSHQLLLSGLDRGQSYYFDVESQDLSGGITRDDNGGMHYRFTTNDRSDLLLVLGVNDFERRDRYVSSLDALGWSYDIWEGPVSDSPPLGDLDSGLRSYKGVWWQPGLDVYPPLTDPARDALTQYLDNGGRLAIDGHDLAWALGDSTAATYSVARRAWLKNTLHTLYKLDPPGWPSVVGVGGDPISGAYTGGGAPYQEHRGGASGDEIDGDSGAGTLVFDWMSSITPDPAGIRWESNGPLGTPGTGVWAGAKTRLATMNYEWSSVDPANVPASATRTDIMSKTLVWLLGRNRPTVTVTAPNGGGTVSTDMLSIQWTESTAGGTLVGSRTIQYSVDGGQSWVTLSTSAGPSPYAWDLTSVPNTSQALVRVRIADNGSPAFTGSDASNATFTIDRVGGDVLGPVVVAGSIQSDPNPIDNQAPANLTASLSEATTGGDAIVEAEWSFGASPATAGNGNAMSGGFGGSTAAVSAALTTGTFPTGTRKIWVRGRDQAGNWGPASALSVVVNGNALVSVTELPRRLEMSQNVPNPMSTTTTISLALPQATRVDLAIFDLQGRKVRSLIQGGLPAGVHRVDWDRRDTAGHLVQPGVYYYRMVTPERSFQRKLVTLH